MDFIIIHNKNHFIFIDNLDKGYLWKIKKENNLNRSLFLIISKSGNTTETITNSSFFRSFLKKNNSIVISEDKDNALRNFAKKKDIYFVRHHPNIGGRYSVFSDVIPISSIAKNNQTIFTNIRKNKPNKTP